MIKQIVSPRNEKENLPFKFSLSLEPTIEQKKLLMTRFEDLSNELFYEIFDYFDSCYIYETFSYLNSRFYHLINYSSLPLKFNFSLLSKTTFKYRYNHILVPNVHRIISLRLSHYLLIDYLFTSFSLNSSFSRLEAFTVDNINSSNLISILTSLASLPRLYSLTIASIDKIESRDIIYCLIIRLPVLKYCKLSLDVWNQDFDLSLNNNEYSPVEHLIIDTKCNLNELFELLTYTPQLNRLSCKISTLNSSLFQMYIIPSNLNNIHLQLEDTSFDEFEWFISSFCHQLQVLYISTEHDIEFLNADRWQRLISCQMPLLQKFYFQYQTIINEDWETYHSYYTLMKEFDSSFWRDRQWFFTYQHYKSNIVTSRIRFYSTKPYRWNHYEFHDAIGQNQETGLNLAYEVDLHSYQVITQYSIRFPRTTRMILSEGNMTQDDSCIFDLTRLFSSTQLTELIISDENFRFEHLLLLLHYFPNIQLLTIPISILYLSLPQSETNRLTIDKNKILKVTILNQCTLEDVQILLRFCPCLQSIDIEVEKENLELILHFLLLKNTNRIRRDRLSPSLCSKNIRFWKQEYTDCIDCTNNQSFNPSKSLLPCNHHLSSLCCRNINYRMIEKIRRMINQQTLLDNYSIEYLDQKMYLWW